MGSVPTWGQLTANDGSAVLEISINRTLIGRSLDCDIRVANQEVSRHHVIIYREDGITLARDPRSFTADDERPKGRLAADRVSGDLVGALGELDLSIRL